MDVSDRQDRPRRAEIRAFSSAGGHNRALAGQGVARIEIAVAQAVGPVRPGFAGCCLPRRIPGMRGVLCPCRDFGRGCAALGYEYFRNPHHVRGGLDNFVVQALRRQECVTDQKHRRQCRSGRRGLMNSGAILGLMLLAGLLTAAPARAEDAPARTGDAPAHAENAPQSCEVPDYLLATESALPKVADAAKSGHALDILVIGSRSSTLNTSEGIPWPRRLQADLP